MDSKEKRKQYYIDNRDKIIERNKKYYHDNKDERQKYNYEYWSVNGHKYMEERKEKRKEKRKNLKFQIIPNIIVYFN